jgi:hypothetical protein
MSIMFGRCGSDYICRMSSSETAASFRNWDADIFLGHQDVQRASTVEIEADPICNEDRCILIASSLCGEVALQVFTRDFLAAHL